MPNRLTVVVVAVSVFAFITFATWVAYAAPPVVVSDDLGTGRLLAWGLSVVQMIVFGLGVLYLNRVAQKFFSQESDAIASLKSVVIGIFLAASASSIVEIIKQKLAGS